MHIESYAISKKDGLKGKAPECPKIYWKQEKNFDRCDFPVSLLTLLGHNGHFIADRSWHRPPSCRGLRKMPMPLGRCKKGHQAVLSWRLSSLVNSRLVFGRIWWCWAWVGRCGINYSNGMNQNVMMLYAAFEVDAVTALINHRADVNAVSGASSNCLQQTVFG